MGSLDIKKAPCLHGACNRASQGQLAPWRVWRLLYSNIRFFLEARRFRQCSLKFVPIYLAESRYFHPPLPFRARLFCEEDRLIWIEECIRLRLFQSVIPFSAIGDNTRQLYSYCRGKVSRVSSKHLFDWSCVHSFREDDGRHLLRLREQWRGVLSPSPRAWSWRPGRVFQASLSCSQS